MKLYTEKEIRKAILIGSIHLKSKTIDELVKALTPIELPSDDEIEEIKQKARDYGNSLVEKQETVFENAKLILRKHILKNKEQVIKDLDEMREKSNEQETLQEVAERYSANELSQLGFISGAKSDAAKEYWYAIFKQNL